MATTKLTRAMGGVRQEGYTMQAGEVPWVEHPEGIMGARARDGGLGVHQRGGLQGEVWQTEASHLLTLVPGAKSQVRGTKWKW